MNKKILSWVLHAPLYILVIASFFGSVYAAVKNIQGITFVTPVILGIIIVLHVVGRKLEKHKNVNF